MKMFSEGAEAKVFETRVFGKKVLVKRREAKVYRIRELDQTLRKTRTRKEAKAMLKAADAGVRVPALLGLGEFSIYMEKFSGKLLKDTSAAIDAYSKMGAMLAEMHNANVVHGDFTPANIMTNRKEICIIDFGLADITDGIEDRALDLLLMKRSVDRKRYAVLENAYSKESKKAKEVLSRLADIERRGRYQTRTLT